MHKTLPPPPPYRPATTRSGGTAIVLVVVALLASMLTMAGPASAQTHPQPGPPTSTNTTQIRAFGNCVRVPSLHAWGAAVRSAHCEYSNRTFFRLWGGGQITLDGAHHSCLERAHDHQLRLARCNGSIQQKFQVTLAGEIVSRATRECLNINQPYRPNNSALTWQSCNGRGRQAWQFTSLAASTRRCTNAGATNTGARYEWIRITGQTDHGFEFTVKPTQSTINRKLTGWYDFSRACTPRFYSGGIWSSNLATPGMQNINRLLRCHTLGWDEARVWTFRSTDYLTGDPTSWRWSKCGKYRPLPR